MTYVRATAAGTARAKAPKARTGAACWSSRCRPPVVLQRGSACYARLVQSIHTPWSSLAPCGLSDSLAARVRLVRVRAEEETSGDTQAAAQSAGDAGADDSTAPAPAVGHDIYVGNLPWATTGEELKETFSEFGTVLNVHLPQATTKGRIQGFGFVKFESKEAADKALSLHGSELGGRPLKVAPASVSK